MHIPLDPSAADVLRDIIGPYSSPSPLRIEGGTRRVLSLFSGGGGMDIGLEGGFICPRRSLGKQLDWIESELNEHWVRVRPTPFRTVFANDIFAAARTAWMQYAAQRGAGEQHYHLESIVELVKRHRAGQFAFPTDIDLVIGGFPCQDFSIAGKRRGFASERSHEGKRIQDGDQASEETRGMLYYWMREVISITQPRMFIAENVKGLVNLADVKEIIQRDFAQAADDGYIVLSPRVLHAGDYGVPESRERVFFVGIKRSALRPGLAAILEQDSVPPLYDPYPAATHSEYPLLSEEREPWVQCAEIFAALREPEYSSDPSQQYYSRAKYMGAHCQGQTEIKLHGLGPTIRSEHHGNIEYRRLGLEHGGRYREELEAGLRERRLTPRECALIQTFPPDYPFVTHRPGSKHRFTLSSSMAYKVIGNAVPPVLAYHFAQRLAELWEVYFES